MTDPKAPQLPPKLPEGLRRFLMCEIDQVEIADGPLAWLEGAPPMSIKPGEEPGTASIEMTINGAPVKIPASIVDGALHIDLQWAVDAELIPKDAGSYFDDLNTWFKAHGKAWGQPTFGNGTVKLFKLPIAAPAMAAAPGAGLATPAPKPKPGPPTDIPKHDPIGGTAPMPYLDTPIPPPPLPKDELFPPGGDPIDPDLLQGSGKSLSGMVPGPAEPSPGVGAGGNGTAKMPRTVAAAGIVALVGVITIAVVTNLFGSGSKPVGTSGPSGSQAPVVTPAGTPSSSDVAASPTQGGGAACPVAAAMRGLTPSGIDELELCEVFLPDGLKDRVEYSGVPVTLAAEQGDIVRIGVFKLDITPARQKQIAERCGVVGTGLHCGEKPVIGGMHTVFVIETSVPIMQEQSAFFELSIAMNETTPGNGVGSTLWQGPPGDSLNGANLAYSQRFASIDNGFPTPGLFRLGYDSTSKTPIFFDTPSSAFSYQNGPFMFYAVPDLDTVAVTMWRAFSFLTKDDSSGSGVDLAPNHDQPMVELKDVKVTW